MVIKLDSRNIFNLPQVSSYVTVSIAIVNEKNNFHSSAFILLSKCRSHSGNKSHVIQAFLIVIIITQQALYVFKTPGTFVLPNHKWL
jgi:hypothetical protein